MAVMAAPRHLSIVTYLQDAKIDGAIIVTTPQEVTWLTPRRREETLETAAAFGKQTWPWEMLGLTPLNCLLVQINDATLVYYCTRRVEILKEILQFPTI